MKYLCVALCACAVLFCAKLAVSSPADLQACSEKSGVTTATLDLNYYEEIVAFAEGNEADEKMKCHIRCIMTNNGTMTEDGKLTLQPMLQLFPMTLHAAIKECVMIDQGEDPCDLAYRYQKCVRDMEPEAYKSLLTTRAQSSR